MPKMKKKTSIIAMAGIAVAAVAGLAMKRFSTNADSGTSFSEAPTAS